MPHIIRARLADVEVQWNLARKLQLRARIATAQSVLQRLRLLMQRGHQRFHRTARRLKSYQDKRPAAFAKKNWIVEIKV